VNRSQKRIVLTGKPHDRRHPLDDGGVRFTTFVPLQFKRRGLRKVVVAPQGVDTPVTLNVPTSVIAPNQDAVLIKALARGYYWQRLLDTAVVSDTAEIARRERIHRATVNDFLRLAILAPDIVQAAFEGQLARTVTLERLLCSAIPLDWGKHRELIAALG